MAFGIQNGATLEQLQVIRYPNEIILDKIANIGEWDITPNASETDVWAGTKQTITPTDEGLYLLNLQIKGQPMVQAWFIMADKNSSASPVVTSPKLGQIFTDPRPLFKWNVFLSPEYKVGENVRLDVRVNQAGGDELKITQVRLTNTKADSYRFGDRNFVKNFEGPEHLPIGDYSLSVVYREIEMFGGLQLKRSSSTKVPFSIK